MEMDEIMRSEDQSAKEALADDRRLHLWPQAARELGGFALHLERNGAGITALQLRMAIQLANEAYRLRRPS